MNLNSLSNNAFGSKAKLVICLIAVLAFGLLSAGAGEAPATRR
jgi:hypothetical protein